MRLRSLTLEHAFYALALTLALAARLLNLGAQPLSDGEASWALQAQDLSLGQQAVFGPQPGYLALTSLAFSVLDNTNFLARFWPALAGAALCLAPFFFRKVLGRPAAVLLAFGLALDPGMVAAARQVGGPMLALGAFALALGLFYTYRYAWAAGFAGLALLGGPAILHGLLGGALALGALYALNRRQPAIEPEETEDEQPALDVRQSLFIALGVVIVLGTLFIRFPQGLGAWIAGLPAYLRGWAVPSGAPALCLLAALLVYQPLALIFGLLGGVSAWRGEDDTGRGLSLWFALSLLLVVLYPGRQVSDLVWPLLPLWALAAMQLSAYLRPLSETSHMDWEVEEGATARKVAFIQAGGILVLMTVFWLNLVGLGQAGLTAQAGGNLRLLVMGGLVALVGVITWLVGLGWSWWAARGGLALGVCAALGLYTLSGMWGASQAGFANRQDLWQSTPVAGDARLLGQTLADLSEWSTGQSQEIDVTVALDSPALHWLVRDYPNVSFIPQEQAQTLSGSPSIVITQQAQFQPSLAAAYRGQDFVWWVSPGWSGALPPDATYWLVSRRAPVVEEQVILWARGDLFPGELPSAALQEEDPLIQEELP